NTNCGLVGSVRGGALPALSCQVWKCAISVPTILSKIRKTSEFLTLWAREGYRLVPPCSMNAKWNPAVLAIAWMWFAGDRSASDLGIAGCCPTFKFGTAWRNVNVGSKSGLCPLLRYRVHQLVSTVSCMRFVSRPICRAPVALLLGKVRNGSRVTGDAPFADRYALMKVK